MASIFSGIRQQQPKHLKRLHWHSKISPLSAAVCAKEQSTGAAQTAAAADKPFLENSGIYVEKET